MTEAQVRGGPRRGNASGTVGWCVRAACAPVAQGRHASTHRKHAAAHAAFGPPAQFITEDLHEVVRAVALTGSKSVVVTAGNAAMG